MNGETVVQPPLRSPKTAWLRLALIFLVSEKIIQHLFVTTAFYFNWGEIASTVVVNSDILMILGAVVAILFVISLWGLITQRKWTINLVLGLALFDVIGEFIAQGRIAIAITVSFVVATILLILTLLYRRQMMIRTV